MSEPSVFTRIINGEIPSHKVYEDDRVIAFLSIRPLCEGHTLVVPKKQIEQLWDIETDDYHYLWDTAKKIALHLQGVLETDRVGVVVKGFEVPHTHIHLLPVNFHSGVNFDPEIDPGVATDDELAAIAEKLKM